MSAAALRVGRLHGVGPGHGAHHQHDEALDHGDLRGDRDGVRPPGLAPGRHHERVTCHWKQQEN